MEKKLRKPNWNGKELYQRAAKAMRPMPATIGRLSFWGVASLCLLLRLILVCPAGALAAIAVGSIWAYWNISLVKCFLMKLLDGLTGLIGGYEKNSLWYEHGGRDTIHALVALLTVQGVNYCNLTEHIEDFPAKSHWYAISNGLRKTGIITQLSRDAFYITWHLPQMDETVSDAV